MAIFIPSFNQVKHKMTAGEKRVAEILRTQLDDACMVWYDIPVGKKRRYPDFVILHPRRGLLFLEVKDWKLNEFKNLNPKDITRITKTGLKTEAHPLEQVRQSGFAAINSLSQDKALQQVEGSQPGKIKFAYGFGVVFTNIARSNIHKIVSEEKREVLLPDNKIWGCPR